MTYTVYTCYALQIFRNNDAFLIKPNIKTTFYGDKMQKKKKFNYT